MARTGGMGRGDLHLEAALLAGALVERGLPQGSNHASGRGTRTPSGCGVSCSPSSSEVPRSSLPCSPRRAASCASESSSRLQPCPSCMVRSSGGRGPVGGRGSRPSLPSTLSARSLPRGPPRESQPHLVALRESLAEVEGLPELRGVEEEHRESMSPRPPDGLARDSARVSLSPVRPLRVHGHEVRSGRSSPAGTRLAGHNPDAAARHGLTAVRLCDPAYQLPRLHPCACPPPVGAVRRGHLLGGGLEDLLPHPAAVADEQTKVVERGPPDPDARHGSADPRGVDIVSLRLGIPHGTFM